MLTQTATEPVVDVPVSTVAERPVSAELGDDIGRLNREEREAIDRRRQEELARLRRIQDQD